jgi:glycosyltransferase involved in cell wall biosynthesis
MKVQHRKILFLGETYRADAQTWINGLKEFGNFEVVSWELKGEGNGWKKLFRFIEFLLLGPWQVRQTVKQEKPDMVIAERTTSYGYLAAISGVRPIAVAQQGVTDLFPAGSPMIPIKKRLQKKAFATADLLHAWGPVMAEHMQRVGADMQKVMVMPKGIDLRKFTFTSMAQKEQKPIKAIVTRSLTPVYSHEVILDAAKKVHEAGVNIEWLIVGDGFLLPKLQQYAKSIGIAGQVRFVGRVPNHDLPKYLAESTFYVSMPISEGVSSSLFEAMATGCYPLVTDLPGNRSWIQHEQNGHLIPIGNAEALAAALVGLQQQPEYLRKATEANRALVEEVANFNHNMKKISDRYHALIDAAQASRRK